MAGARTQPFVPLSMQALSFSPAASCCHPVLLPLAVGGAPLTGAVVEACRGDSGVVLDSALTDNTGAYRVGNLKPGNTYLMRVRLDGRVITAHPSGHKVRVVLQAIDKEMPLCSQVAMRLKYGALVS